ncbi:hypothetical protein M422DRAFT_213804 [Sphaerobolus stellatus SS14]|uniref:Eukaryotic translation initiation factor 2A n=1 Tax=Sphaerobolus stellatus (strain SS14) TaxID=990650 RepID=A0A0C9UTA3_SPHS4|nr:hypothetical protein M422DRAFT_213804 [Sphaerobolus stellatus SS14]
MADVFPQQYAFRSQKQLGLIGNGPSYAPVDGFEKPDATARICEYSRDGKLFAYVLPTGVRIINSEDGALVQEIAIPNVVELGFSPKATFLSTWERPTKAEDGTQHKNLRIFSLATGEEVYALSQKSQENWNLQYTDTETHALRLAGPEIQVFHPSTWSKGVVDKVKVEGCTYVNLGPGKNPHVAVFVGEKNGQPAAVRIHSLLALSSPPTSQKTFFKADRAQIKWNALGTQVLVLTQTDVDKTNKSYYGETMLYLLSAAGNFDCRVTLDKEGPIHDFSWSPNSKEFGVVYGYMPAKGMLFDQRVRTLHDFGAGPTNTISFNPQGRLIMLAGFGNLAGKVDIYDRRTLGRVTTIDAPNSSWCEWSPDGKFLLTATLSPRLRVDNGIKIWHCTGPLIHIHMIDELYQVSWRPTPVDQCPAFGQTLPIAPAPSPSAVEHTTAKPPPVKAAGAYRPPGARGTAAPAIYQRDVGPSSPSNNGYGNGNGNGQRYVPGAHANGNGNNNGQRRRNVPGASPAGSPAPTEGGEKKGKPKRKKTPREDGKVPNGTDSPVASPSPAPIPAVTAPDAETAPAGEGSLDPVAKKIRNLNKKIKAIDELKEKQGRGERLEATQLKKIESEAEIRKELSGLLAQSGPVSAAAA